MVPVVVNSNAPVQATMTDNSSGVSRNVPVLVEPQGNPRRQRFRRTTINRGTFTLAAMRRIRYMLQLCISENAKFTVDDKFQF